MNKVYLVRAGRHGEREVAAIEGGVATIGFDNISDLRKYKSRDAVKAEFTTQYPRWSGDRRILLL